MLILAQAETVTTGILNLFDKYGVAWGMLVLFVIATIYMLRRLLNEKTGILTGYVHNTQDQQKHLADTVRSMSETDAKMAHVLEESSERLQAIEASSRRLEEMHMNPHSQFATVTLGRCFRNGCDVLQHVAEKLEIEEKCGPLIDVMRRELDLHIDHMADLDRGGGK